MTDAIAALLSGEKSIIVADVEATCWKKSVWNKKKETIEIGAVRFEPGVDPARAPEFQTFVRPKNLPRLSTFCIELTGIKQEDVDPAPLFPEAFHRFLEWAAPLDRIVLATWSTYDLWQIDLDLENNALPKLKLPHLDVKKLAHRLVGRLSFEATAEKLGVPFEQGRHRAIFDARKTAEILHRLLPAR
jgi:inhibitor of KinA sporulation pathway (predicted exonuclease)